MISSPYKIYRICRKSQIGITIVSLCTLNPFRKSDSVDSPHCAYNEQVTNNLAKTLHVPTAKRVTTTTEDGQTFASREVSAPGLSLPDQHPGQLKKVAPRYPDKVAALVAFYIFGRRKSALIDPFF